MRISDFDNVLLDSILQSLKGKDIFELGLVGLGEPTLSKHFNQQLEVVGRYQAEFSRISLNSNAVALNKKKTDIILNSVINMITFSLNATNRESYIKLMRYDLFDSVVNNIIRFIKLRNARGRRDLDIGIQFMSSKINDEKEMKILFDEYIDMSIELYSRPAYNKPVFQNNDEMVVECDEVHRGNRHPCWSIYSRIYIDVDGNVYPCTIGNDCYRDNSKLNIGNVSKQEVIHIYNNFYIKDARNAAENGCLPFAECRNCSVWSLLPNNFQWIDDRWVYSNTPSLRLRVLDRKNLI